MWFIFIYHGVTDFEVCGNKKNPEKSKYFGNTEIFIAWYKKFIPLEATSAENYFIPCYKEIFIAWYKIIFQQR